MILLLGGTAETRDLAKGLSEAGYRVLVSTATGIPLMKEEYPNVECRSGRLDEAEFQKLLLERKIRLIVDATHPYAQQIRKIAAKTAERAGVPYLTYLRPAGLDRNPCTPQSAGHPCNEVILASDHPEAAHLACSLGKPILLTIGSRNLEVYLKEARRTGIKIAARVLDDPASIESSRLAGLPEEGIIAGRGPFSLEENRALIRELGAGVLVTKDSGVEGGFREKVEAAALEGCRVIVVRRPENPVQNVYENLSDLIEAVKRRMAHP